MHSIRISIALVAALVLGACGGGGGGGDGEDGPVAPPTGGASGPAAPTTVSGPDGSSITVPAAALATPATVRIARDSSAAPPLPSVFKAAGDTYAVTPDGQALATLATLRIPIDPASDDSVTLAESNADGTWTFREDARRVGATLEIEVARLGQYRAVRFDDGSGVSTAAASAAKGDRRLQPGGIGSPDAVRLSAPGWDNASSVTSIFPTTPYDGPARVTFTGESPPKLPPAVTRCPTATSIVQMPFNVPTPAGASAGVGWYVLPQETTVLQPKRAGPWTFDVRLFRPARPYGSQLMNVAVKFMCESADGTRYGTYTGQNIGYELPDADAVGFLRQPEDRSTAIGAAADYTVRVFGGPTAPSTRDQYRLVWERSADNGSLWSAIGTAYQTDATDVSPTDGRLHAVQLRNLAGADNGALIRARACYAPPGQVEKCVTSATARLTVAQDLVAPAISQQPRSLSTRIGETASFTVAATGTPAPAIQWQMLGGDLSSWVDVGSGSATWPGATPNAPTLVTLPGTPAQNGWLFRAIARNAAGSATSEPVVWRVTELTVAPTIVTQPSSTTVPLGSTALFAAVADGTAPLSYQWSRNGVSIAGANSPVLSLADVQAAALGSYRVTVTGPGGSAVSQAATLAAGSGGPVATLPSITTQPGPAVVPPGATATFTLVATGTPTPQCQWIRNSVAIIGATSCTSYTTPAATLADNGAVYNVVVYNTGGAVFGGGAVLTVSGPATGTLALLAGDLATVGSADGAALGARFDFPYGAAIDSRGNTYVVDCNNHTVRKITPAGVVTTLAGSPGLPGSADGIGSAARFNSPIGIAVDAGFNLYVADNNNHTIRRITADGVVTTLAGTALSGGSADGTGAAARFQNPYAIALDAAGNLHVADTYGYTIRRVTPAGVVTTVAGVHGLQGSSDGSGAAARFTRVFSIALDSLGNAFIADRDNHSIRKITPAGVVSTFAGLSGSEGSADGTGAEARFKTPQAVVVDGSDNVYVADFGNHTIRRITPAGVVTTVLGFAGQQGVRLGADPRLDEPRTLALLGRTFVIPAGNAVLTYTLP